MIKHTPLLVSTNSLSRKIALNIPFCGGAPPQKGMFKAIFLDNELVDTSNGVCFINPKKDTNFDKIYKLIETTLSKAEKPVSFTELSDLLNSPPFGLKRGPSL